MDSFYSDVGWERFFSEVVIELRFEGDMVGKGFLGRGRYGE